MPISKIKLLESLPLTDFPSGSSINYRNGQLYLIGDDANNILILDTHYKRIDSKKLFDFPDKRIPKPVKADLEASTLITIAGQDYLLILGSASTPSREKIFLIPFLKSGLDMPHFRVLNDEIFTRRLQVNGIDEVNIEGATMIGKNLIFSNRGNRKNITNHFIITDIGFWEHQASADLKVLPVQVPAIADDAPGISELCYVDVLDLLLISFSSELTDNPYDDGAIGNSYIGWINKFSLKIQNPDPVVEKTINLSEVHADFKNQKIEGLCVESVNDKSMIIHLISDNDQGESKLFKVKMPIPA
ncbi:MAG: hypothetical protein C0490_16105 [Marivirga sp.]|nr:hypothetical protein [Marivirga sp.]